MKLKNLFFNSYFSRHPNPNLQLYWNCFQASLLIFPVWPAVGAVSIGALVLAIYQQQLKNIIYRPLNWGLAILTIWLAITACFAFDRQVAFLGLANLLPYFIVFAGLSSLIQTPSQLRRMAWILVLPSVPIVIIGLGQLFLGWAGSPLLLNTLGWEIVAKGNPPNRMASVFMYANILAAYLVIVFVLALGLWIEEWGNRSTGNRDKAAEENNNHHSPVNRQHSSIQNPKSRSVAARSAIQNSLIRLGFLSVAVLGSAVALILTDSRNAWGVTILTCLAFALYQGWHWLVGGVTAIAASVLGAAYAPSPLSEWLRGIVPALFWSRLTPQMYSDRPPAFLRVNQWRFAWSLAQQRPWTGWGLRNFTPIYESQMQVWLGHPHSLFLMLAAETGILATLMFCGLVGWILAQGVLLLVRSAFKLRQDRLIFLSYLIAFGACTLFNTVDVTIFDLRVNTLGWLLLSAICGVVYQQQVLVNERK